MAASRDAPLAHTSQLFAVDDQGSLIGRGDAGEQSDAVLGRIDQTLRGVGSGLDQVVKLNVALARAEDLPAFRASLVKRVGNANGPALSLVVGELAVPGALAAADAVALANFPGSLPPGRVPLYVDPGTKAPLSGAHAAVSPPGPRVYISGQADPGEDLAEATRKTLEGLRRTLQFLELDTPNVVQIKAFFQPMASASVVEREVARFFGGPNHPPIVLVDWRMPQPIEIELIAAAMPGNHREPVEYLTPPGLKPSPVFCRVVRINNGETIYVSSLFGPAGATGEGQVESIFAELTEILAEARGDLHHLAKATYYVSDDEASNALNVLRPRYYDPARPPAASKATVPSVGRQGRTVSLDMIAVGVPRP